MLASENTLRSAAPSVDVPLLPTTGDTLVLAGGTLVELHPPRMGKADVVVRGEHVVQIGGAIPEDLPRHDVSGCVVMPALVVGHTHLYMSLACGMPPPPSPPRTLTDSLQWVWWALDKSLDAELVHTSALVGAAIAAKAGASCVIDHHSSPRAIEGSLDRVEAALEEIGIRGILCYETSDRDGRARRDAGLNENRRFLEKVRARKTKHRGLVGAHALMTLNDDSLDALRGLADAYGVGMHLHVAEDHSDALDAERKRKTTLARRLERLGVARRGSIVAHAVQLDASTVDLLVQAGGYVVTTPRSDMMRGIGLCGAGGRGVGVGTDGVDEDVLAEARAYFLRHSETRDGLARETGARVATTQELAADLFEDPVAPRIVPGARADLAILEYEGMTPMSPSNVIEHLALGWTSGHVRDTLVGGRFVVRGRKLQTVDERELAMRARAAATRLWERIQGYT